MATAPIHKVAKILGAKVGLSCGRSFRSLSASSQNALMIAQSIKCVAIKPIRGPPRCPTIVAIMENGNSTFSKRGNALLEKTDCKMLILANHMAISTLKTAAITPYSVLSGRPKTRAHKPTSG